jgi:signal transduction histidine kinase
MVSDTGVDLQIQSTGKPRPLGAEVEDQLLRICQEALANVLKHANASRIELSFDFSPDRPLLCIRDNGSGFDLERVGSRNGHHFGLQGMKERVEQLGGALKIKTDQGKGTEIAVYLK